MASKNSNNMLEPSEDETPKDPAVNAEAAHAKVRCRAALLGVLEDMRKASEFTASLREQSLRAKEAASIR